MGMFVSRVVSVYSNRHEDRKFVLACQSMLLYKTTDNCYFPDYVNYFDKPVDFQCPLGFTIIGFSSYHHNKYEDRRFRYKCCQISSKDDAASEHP